MVENKQIKRRRVREIMKDLEEGYNEMHKKAPFTSAVMWTTYIIMIIALTWFVQSYFTKTIPIEYEFSCNTGFIGIDFQSEFINEEWKPTTYGFPVHNFTRYETNILPHVLNLKNINGLNCQGKFKTEISLDSMNKFIRTMMR